MQVMVAAFSSGRRVNRVKRVYGYCFAGVERHPIAEVKVGLGSESCSRQHAESKEGEYDFFHDGFLCLVLQRLKDVVSIDKTNLQVNVAFDVLLQSIRANVWDMKRRVFQFFPSP